MYTEYGFLKFVLQLYDYILFYQFYEGDTEMRSLEHSGKYRGRSASSHDDSTSVSSFRDGDEKKVFEDQLNLLQEQLVSAMIENQNLGIL